jgi:hypothetical protein
MRRWRPVLVLTCAVIGCAIGSLGGVLGAIDGFLLGTLAAFGIIEMTRKR